jgi:hypothetical protein
VLRQKHIIEKHGLIIVLALYLAAECLINPYGEFPLNDDWAYSLSVEEFVNTGKLHFSFWQAIPGLSQFFAGAAAAKIFSFSFTLLRLISVGCVLLMIFILEYSLRLLEINAFRRFAALCVCVFNPLTLILGNTWLPDVFQLFLSLTAFAVFIFYMKSGRIFLLLLFAVLCILATLNRQTGLIIPLCTGISYLYLNKPNGKNIVIAVLPVGISFISLLIFENIASSAGLLSSNYGLQLHNILSSFSHPVEAAKKFAYYLITSSVCMGLLLLPFFISSLKAHFKSLFSSKRITLIFFFYILLIGLKIFLTGKNFPFTGNIFYDRGIGPVIMTGFNSDEPIHVSPFESGVLILLNFAGGTGFFCLLQAVLLNVKNERNALRKFSTCFFLLLSVFYLFPLCLSYVNDRYLLLLIPFLLISLAQINLKMNQKLYLSALIVYMLISVTAVHDYMELNRVRSKAINDLMNKENVDAEKIDGGFEFNAWHFSEKRPYKPSHKGRWWWVQNEKYIVSLAFMPEYKMHGHYSYSSWLTCSQKHLYVYEKE